MRAILVVGVDANDQTYFERAPFYNVKQGLRPAKSYENRSELIYVAARSCEIDNAMEKPRPIYCLIRSDRYLAWRPIALGPQQAGVQDRLELPNETARRPNDGSPDLGACASDRHVTTKRGSYIGDLLPFISAFASHFH